MAQQPSNESRGKPPISKHPLFPAIVALWFGALFGLGSMAIRPTLIESLVIASRLDTLVPSAAPPLGLTARILIGVIMAAIGGVLGAIIARRIGRDKPVEHARRRGADTTKAADSAKVESMREGTGSRRRSLALSEEADEFTPYEVVPLPGGGLNILDVTAVEITPAPASAMERPVQIAPEPESEPMELTEFAAEAQPDSVPYSAAPFAAPEPVASAEAPHAGLGRFAAPEQAAPRAPFAPPAVEAAEPAAFRPAAIELQQFQPEPSPRFAAPEQVKDTAQPEPAAPFANPFAGEPARPIDFSQPAFTVDAPVFAPVVEPELVVEQAAFAPQPAIVPAPEAAPVSPGAPFPTTLDDAAIARIAGADLDALSPVELVERLALSIQNRRKARLAASAAVIPPVPTPTAPMPVEFSASPAPAMPEQAPSAFGGPANAFVAPANPVPEAYSPPAPVNNEPEDNATDTASNSGTYAAGSVLPAALRPLSLDMGDEDDSVLDALPPRHIALPPAVGLFGNQPETSARLFDQRADLAAPAPFAAPQAEVEEYGEGDGDAEAIAEESYSSLLDLGRPVETRNGFVRIEEPEQDHAATEPVVIFPGQGLRQPAFPSEAPVSHFSAPDSDGMAAENQVRRFDSPSAVASGAPAFAASVQPQQDAAVTEQALRSALANLQRMSGAA